VSPEYIDVARLPAALSRWDVLVAPEPVPTVNDPLGVVSKWGSINLLMLDEQRCKRCDPVISGYASMNGYCYGWTLLTKRTVDA
jgi:hypothetical protein